MGPARLAPPFAKPDRWTAPHVYALRLLNDHRFRHHRSPPLPFSFLFPLLIGRDLPHRDLVKGAPLRFHPDMGVAREHSARDGADDAYDHLVARTGLGELSDQRVAVIVPP